MRKWLWHIVEDNTTRKGRIFDYTIQGLIMLSLVAFAVDTLPDLSAETRSWLNVFEVFCVVVFSIEYLLRIYVAKKPFRYIFSFYGIVDLLAILPFYLNSALDWRALRSFRILRLVRALKLIRYNKALERFAVATLVEAELLTGRTHQIRVHMAHIRYPLLGDPVYGGRFSVPAGVSDELEQALRGFKRQALHARRLSFQHPVSDEALSFEALIPDDMQNMIEVLRRDAQQ